MTFEPVIEPSNGVSHRLNGDGQTVCGQDASEWARRVPELMLIVKCAPCWGKDGRYLIITAENTPDGAFTSVERGV